MIIEIIFLTFSLVCLLLASFFDLKSREVPDYLSYSFIFGALGISLLYSIYTSFSFFVYSLLTASLFFSFGYFLYRTKQMGGADVKLITGLGAVFANQFLWDIPLAIIFLLALTIFGSLYTLLWGFVLYLKSFHLANKRAKEFLQEKRSVRFALLLFSLFALIVLFLIQNKEVQMLIAAFVLILIGTFYLSIFIRVIENLYFIKKLNIKELTVGDWLAKDVKISNKVICSAKNPCLDKKQIEILKKAKIETVTIKVGIPFVPAIFLATLGTFLLYFFV